jgi:hypothetical protein
MKDDIIPHIFHLDNLDDVWNVLKELYESVGTTRGLLLMNKFYKMSMQETRNMVNFLFIVKNLLGQIVRFIDVIKDEDVSLIVLNFLFDSYENFVQNVGSKDTFKL